MNSLLVVLFCGGLASVSAVRKLPHIINDGGSHEITLSGFTSGANFAQQVQFSFPHIFRGIAVFSHTFYRCGSGNGKAVDFNEECTILHRNVSNPKVTAFEELKRNERRGLVGNLHYWLRDKRLYVNVLLGSHVFSPSQTLNVVNLYERYIQDRNDIKIRFTDASSVFPTNNPRLPTCKAKGRSKSAYLGYCGYSGAFDALSFLLGDRVKNEPKEGEKVRSKLLEFDQTEFTKNLKNHFMDKVGYYYLPTGCKDTTPLCAIHMYFHGCQTGREFLGSAHVEFSGFLEVAEKNNIVMIFPQALSSLPENEYGCWDTYGIGGRFYATKVGPQVVSIIRMVDRLIGSRFRIEEKDRK